MIHMYVTSESQSSEVSRRGNIVVRVQGVSLTCILYPVQLDEIHDVSNCNCNIYCPYELI